MGKRPTKQELYEQFTQGEFHPHDFEASENEIEGPAELIDKGGRKERRKITQITREMRVQQVATWLLDGVPYKEIVRRGMKKWGLTARPVEHYIRDAKEQAEAFAATEFKGAMTLSITRLNRIYHKAMKDGDMKVALDTLKTINRMLGLNAPEKMEMASVSNFDSMELKDQLVEIGAILERATGGEGEDVDRLN